MNAKKCKKLRKLVRDLKLSQSILLRHNKTGQVKVGPGFRGAYLKLKSMDEQKQAIFTAAVQGGA